MPLVRRIKEPRRNTRKPSSNSRKSDSQTAVSPSRRQGLKLQFRFGVHWRFSCLHRHPPFMLAKATLSYWISRPRRLTEILTRTHEHEHRVRHIHCCHGLQTLGPLFRRRLTVSAQESVKMSATEIAVFLEGLEQAVRSADLEVGVGGGGCSHDPT